MLRKDEDYISNIKEDDYSKPEALGRMEDRFQRDKLKLLFFPTKKDVAYVFVGGLITLWLVKLFVIEQIWSLDTYFIFMLVTFFMFGVAYGLSSVFQAMAEADDMANKMRKEKLEYLAVMNFSILILFFIELIIYIFLKNYYNYIPF